MNLNFYSLQNLEFQKSIIGGLNKVRGWLEGKKFQNTDNREGRISHQRGIHFA